MTRLTVAAPVAILLFAVFAGAEGAEDSEMTSEAYRECLERAGETSCKPMRDEGNMNRACMQAFKDCSEAPDENDSDDSEDE